MHFSRHLITALMLLLATVCQAKRVIERPYFAGSNNHRIEIERVTLDKRATLLDVKIYQFGGEVGIDPRAAITAGSATYAYTGSTQLPKGEFVKVPECGYVSATLRFKPMPESTQEFDFREVPDNSGWNVYGVRLDGKRPQTDIPNSLLNQKFASASPLPAPELHTGKTTVCVRLMGYRPEYKTKLFIHAGNWFSPSRLFSDNDKINDDGTCTVTANSIVPQFASIELNGTSFSFLTVPDDTTTIIIDLPALTMSGTHLFAGDKTMRRHVWFEGKYADINTGLQDINDELSVFDRDTYDSICGMTPLQYRDYMRKKYNTRMAIINANRQITDATRTLAANSLAMSYAAALFGYKNNISIAPMIIGKKGVKRADMTIDTLSYFKELESLPVLHSKYLRCFSDIAGFAQDFRRNYITPDPLLDDIALGKRLSRTLDRNHPLSQQQIAAANDSIGNVEVRNLLFAENQKLIDKQAASDNAIAEAKKEAATSRTYSIIDIPANMEASKIMPTIAEKYKGQKILVDMWNTWCVPCMNAMAAIKPLKAELKDVVYVYIANATSPAIKWNETIKTINGTHIRITNEQSAALMELYKYSGIPTYFIIDETGKIIYQKTGFPGVDELRNRLK